MREGGHVISTRRHLAVAQVDAIRANGQPERTGSHAEPDHKPVT